MWKKAEESWFMAEDFEEGSVWQRKAEGKANLYAAVKANFFIPQKFFES